MIRKNSFLLILIFLIMGLATDAVWGGISQMKQPNPKIKIQIKPVVFSEPLPEHYKDMFFNKTEAEMREIINAAENKNKSDNSLLAKEICQNIAKNLSPESISVVERDSEVTIEVSVTKTGVDSLYGPKLIADTVAYRGVSNNKVIFQGEFKQNNKGWSSSRTSIKKPDVIGLILSRKINQEIRNFSAKK